MLRYITHFTETIRCQARKSFGWEVLLCGAIVKTTRGLSNNERNYNPEEGGEVKSGSQESEFRMKRQSIIKHLINYEKVHY